jgi:stringent starvation protein B
MRVSFVAKDIVMTSSRPYFIRALYEWLVDNGLTPHILVDAEADGVLVPQGYVENGQVVLNLSPSAVQMLELGNDFISFNARFGGVPTDISVPPSAVLGIYARENGRGMLFPDEGVTLDGEGDMDDEEPDPTPPTPRPRLRVVK